MKICTNIPWHSPITDSKEASPTAVEPAVNQVFAGRAVGMNEEEVEEEEGEQAGGLLQPSNVPH